MEQDFYRNRLTERHGLRVLIPEQSDRDMVHRVIFEELVLGKVLASSRNIYRVTIAGPENSRKSSVVCRGDP